MNGLPAPRPPDVEVLRFLRAHGPATPSQLAGASGEPTTNFGRQRLGQVPSLLEVLAARDLIELGADGRYRISDAGRRLLAEVALEAGGND